MTRVPALPGDQPLITGLCIRLLLLPALALCVIGSPYATAGFWGGLAYAALHTASLTLARSHPALSSLIAACTDAAAMTSLIAARLAGADLLIPAALVLLTVTFLERRTVAGMLLGVILAVLLTLAARQYTAPLPLPLLAPWLIILLWLAGQTRQWQQQQAAHEQQDALTGLGTRYALQNAIRYFSPYQQRNRTPFTLAALHIHYHEPLRGRSRRMISRRCQRELAHCLESRLRRCDIAARIQDDHFVILLTDSDINGAETLLREIRAAFDAWTASSALQARLVMGACPLPADALSLETLLHALFEELQHPRLAANTPAPLLFFQAERLIRRNMP